MATDQHSQDDVLTLLARTAPRTALALRGVAQGHFLPTENWFRPPSENLLYMVGLEGGDDQREALKWLSQGDHHLVFLEPDVHRLADWLNSEGAREVVSHEKCEVHLLDASICRELAHRQQHSNRDCAVQASSRYVALLPAVRQELLGFADDARRVRDEFLRGGDLFYRNFYANVRRLSGARLGTSLFGAFHDVPAIICGAGPSLPEQLPQRYGGALLLAAGSGLNALLAQGVFPHFGVALDPHHYQLSRVLMHSGFEIPIFFRLRWHAEALAALHAPRLYLPGAGGYSLVEWLESEMDIEGPILEEGPSATCLAVELAQALGCNPVYLAGVDLGLRDGHLYAPGVCHQEAEIAGYGEAKWAAEAQWLSDRDLCVSTSRLIFDGDLRDRVHAAVMAAPYLDVDPSSTLANLRASLAKCQNLLSNIQAHEEPQALHEVELYQELAYEHILEPLVRIFPDTGYEFLKQIATLNLELLFQESALY